MHELSIWNTLDVMHVEWNVSNNFLRYLTKENDIVEVWKDMQKTSVYQHLWLNQGLDHLTIFKLATPYVFTWEEKKSFLEFVSSIQAPTWHVVAFRKHVIVPT
jgi:hypothetical protein